MSSRESMAYGRHLANTIELVHSSAHLSPQPKRQVDRFSRFYTADDRKSSYFTMAAPIHQKCPFPWKIWTSHVTCDAFGPSPFHQIDIIGVMVIVCRVRGKIIRSVLCNILCNIVHSAMHTHMNRPNSSLDWVLSHRMVKNVKVSHTRHRALGPELIPVYRQSACR